MTIEAWTAFVLTSFLIVASPGPVVVYGILVVTRFGLRSIPTMLMGALAGDIIAASLSLAGLGIFLQAFPQIFGSLQVLGGLVMMALAIQMLISKSGPNEEGASQLPIEHGKIGAHIFALTALHPASYVFFASFFPMFIDQSRAIHLQLFLMGSSFIIVAMLTFSAWMIAGSLLMSKGGFSKAAKVFRLIGACWLLLVGLASIASGLGQAIGVLA